MLKCRSYQYKFHLQIPKFSKKVCQFKIKHPEVKTILVYMMSSDPNIFSGHISLPDVLSSCQCSLTSYVIYVIFLNILTVNSYCLHRLFHQRPPTEIITRMIYLKMIWLLKTLFKKKNMAALNSKL